MLLAIALTIWLLIAGDVIVHAVGVPVPGPALAMIALAFVLYRFGGVHAAVGRLFDAIVGAAPLFFVPAALGVVANLDRVSAA